MNRTITTIIPFFNSGNALSIMLDSILAGTMLPNELLLIDDGSSDNSPEIAKEYASKYPFIKYIPKEHAGVSAARNLGIQSACCEWISFLDADDYIESDMYEKLLDAITDESMAGSVCGYYTEVDGISTPYSGNYPCSLSGAELLKAMFTDDNVRGFLFTRLFKTELVKENLFDTRISMCEDLLFQTGLLSANEALSFGYAPYSLYHYVQNSASATNSVNFFNGDVFKYKPAFDIIRKIKPASYIEDSYNSILEYSMYRLLKSFKEGNTSCLSQIKMLQKELKEAKPEHFSKRRYAYIYAPILYSKIMK